MSISTIAHKYPTNRDNYFRDCKTWMDGRRMDDNAEGLWRIHDKLYDLKEFIERHPGGSEWLKITKGVDITEQFETHHITDKAEKLLQNYFVRDAALPRNYKITFHPDGFYKTLKRRVASKITTKFDKSVTATSRFYSDLMLTSTIVSFIFVARNFNFITILMASFCLSLLTIIGHNFIHQRDNWRMYVINLNFQSYRDWRGEFR